MPIEWQQDNGFDAAKAHRQVIESAVGANEDTTRLRAIDTMLFDVLKWDKGVVETEKYCRESGFADYAFSQGESICLIVEAKKSEASFVAPEISSRNRVIGFGLLHSQCREAGNALIQACGYAASLGARYAAITNGHQWILALAFVQGQPIQNRSVFVFHSLDDILSRFSQFWKCFGPDGVYSNLCSAQLLESRKAPAPAKLSSQITNYPEPASRNTLADGLQTVIGLVWDQMDADETEEYFLQECYIHPEATVDNLEEARGLLEKRNATDVDVTHEALAITELPDLISSYKSEKPIVVLGRVGHGKTTFLRYLRLIGAAETLKKYIQIDINFLDRPEKAEEVGEFIYRQVEEQLRTRYSIDIEEDKVVRGALNGDLNRFRKSTTGKLYAKQTDKYAEEELKHILQLQSDRHEYLAKILYHLRQSQQQSVAIFLDNLDRRIDILQEAAFLCASAVARDWACLVFICLRPGTFYRSTDGGILDAVAPKTLTVTSPRTDVLLRKRLGYAAKIAKGDDDASSHPAFSRSVSIHLPATSGVLDCAAESFYRSADLRNLFVSVSNGNIRDLLRYVRRMLTSRHLNTAKIQTKLAEGSYRIPVHEALRALLFQDSMQFDPASSFFTSLFDTSRADPTEHFSRPLALNFVSRAPTASPTLGYVHVEEVLQTLCQVGFSHEHALETLQYLFAKHCCETEVPGEAWRDTGDRVRITSLGKYHVQHLVRIFNYYDAVVVDTPILDDDTRKGIENAYPIAKRLTRAHVFVDYLKNASKHLQDGDSIAVVTAFLDDAKRDIEEIEFRISAV